MTGSEELTYRVELSDGALELWWEPGRWPTYDGPSEVPSKTTVRARSGDSSRTIDRIGDLRGLDLRQTKQQDLGDLCWILAHLLDLEGRVIDDAEFWSFLADPRYGRDAKTMLPVRKGDQLIFWSGLISAVNGSKFYRTTFHLVTLEARIECM